MHDRDSGRKEWVRGDDMSAFWVEHEDDEADWVIGSYEISDPELAAEIEASYDPDDGTLRKEPMVGRSPISREAVEYRPGSDLWVARREDGSWQVSSFGIAVTFATADEV